MSDYEEKKPNELLDELSDDNVDSSTKLGRDEILKKIYVPRNLKEIFRILPPKSGKRFYDVAYFHIMETNVTGGGKDRNKKIYCPKRNDPKVKRLDKKGKPVLQENGEPIMVYPPCPLCDKHDRILSQQNDSVRYKKREELTTEEEKMLWDKNKEIFKKAKFYEPRKFYIVRGINRWSPDDGPKFWRIKDSYTNRGHMDKLKAVLREYVQTQRKDFMSPKNGVDLSIIMSDAKTPSGVKYKDISNITPKNPSPLHEDEYIANQWLNDDITWRDVFKPRKAPNITPHQYLEMLAEGNDPYYDGIDKKWVFPGNPELEEKANIKNTDLSNENLEIEQASDLSYEDDNIDISNITKDDVEEYKDDSVDATDTSILKEGDDEDNNKLKEPTKKKGESDHEDSDDLFGLDDDDDLPF